MRISDWSSDVCSSDLAEPLDHLGADPRPAPRLLGADEIARRRAADIRHREFAPLLLLDPLQPEALAFLPQHAEHRLLADRQPLHRVRDQTLAHLLGAREEAVAEERKSTRLNSRH